MTTRVFLEAAVMHPPKSYHKHIEEPFDSKASLSNKNLKLVSYLRPRHPFLRLCRGPLYLYDCGNPFADEFFELSFLCIGDKGIINAGKPFLL